MGFINTDSWTWLEIQILLKSTLAEFFVKSTMQKAFSGEEIEWNYILIYEFVVPL